MRFAGFVLLGAVTLAATTARAASITQLSSPAQIAGGTTIGFDDANHGDFANTRYLTSGVQFTRDGGGNLFIYDWAGTGRTTSSADNALVAVSSGGGTFSQHVNVLLASPVTEIGAFFGNDQSFASDFLGLTLSVFDGAGTLLGSVSLASNLNTSIDQFIGLRSDVAFSRARFEVTPAQGRYSIGLDDVVFSAAAPTAAVPVPAVAWGGMALLGSLGAARALRRRWINRAV